MKKRILMIGGKSVPSFEETMGRYWQNAAAEPGNGDAVLMNADV